MLKLPSTPAMICHTSFEVFVVTGSPRKSSTRNSVQGASPSFSGVFGSSREASSVANAGGIGRPSTGIGADQTVIAGGYPPVVVTSTLL